MDRAKKANSRQHQFWPESDSRQRGCYSKPSMPLNISAARLDQRTRCRKSHGRRCGKLRHTNNCHCEALSHLCVYDGCTFCLLRLRDWCKIRVCKNLDFDSGFINVSAAGTKSVRGLVIHLPPNMLAVFRRYVARYRPVLVKSVSQEGYLWSGPTVAWRASKRTCTRLSRSRSCTYANRVRNGCGAP